MKKNRTIAWDTDESAGENARRSLPRLAREFFSAGRAAVEGNSTPRQLHDFRLAAKRFRYTLELFEPMYGPMLAERLEQVRKIQSLLGNRQDCIVLSDRLRKGGTESVDVHDIVAKLNAEGTALEEKFRRFWRETFDQPGAEAMWIRYLGRRAAEPRAPRGAIRKSAIKKNAQKQRTRAGGRTT